MMELMSTIETLNRFEVMFYEGQVAFMVNRFDHDIKTQEIQYLLKTG